MLAPILMSPGSGGRTGWCPSISRQDDIHVAAWTIDLMTNNIISIEGSLQNVTSFEGKSCAQDMREADQEFVRSLMERIEEETCLKFTEKKGY